MAKRDILHTLSRLGLAILTLVACKSPKPAMSKQEIDMGHVDNKPKSAQVEIGNPLSPVSAYAFPPTVEIQGSRPSCYCDGPLLRTKEGYVYGILETDAVGGAPGMCLCESQTQKDGPFCAYTIEEAAKFRRKGVPFCYCGSCTVIITQEGQTYGTFVTDNTGAPGMCSCE
jgi:hypothetical protein